MHAHALADGGDADAAQTLKWERRCLQRFSLLFDGRNTLKAGRQREDSFVLVEAQKKSAKKAKEWASEPLAYMVYNGKPPHRATTAFTALDRGPASGSAADGNACSN